MAWSQEITQYKQLIISKLINTPTIVAAIDNKEIKTVEELIYNNIYPYHYVPTIPQEQRTFILISVDVPKVSTANYFFKDLLITITILCHQDLMKTEFGSRTDYISSEIDKLLNGSKEFGTTKLELVSSVEGEASTVYRYRSMRFAAQDVNRPACANI